MKLLPLNDSVKVVCVVRTYLGPVADSKVSFYDTGWNELPADRFVVLPQEGRFYKQPLAETAADSLRNLRLYADMYLKEVFKSGSIDSLDQETLFTIQKFFENNLNVSETSRKLFVHRNTLVYRLEKIKKINDM